MLDLSDADSSATGPQVRAKAGSERRSSAAKVDTCGPSMTGSNPSSETYQDGQGKVSKNSGACKANRPKLPRPDGPPPQCPRCNADTSNTKFCYYNNYNINQPRYYCKACQRHWTDGGTLRKVETGAGKRNSRRQRSHSTAGGDAAANSKAPKTRGGGLHQQQSAHGGAPATRRSAATATVASDVPSGLLMDSMMPDYNSSDAGASFQEGSSFNDKMLLDDECQAIADLDVIFENERLDAILGSSNTMPVETDRPLQQMLGLDNLEDLPTMSQGEADFQRAMMEGCTSNPDAGQLLLSAGGMSTPGTSQGGPLLVADASGPLRASFGDDETASRGPPSPRAVSHTGSPSLQANGGAATMINVDAAFRTHIKDPSPTTAQNMVPPGQHMMPDASPAPAGQVQPEPTIVPVASSAPQWPDGAPQLRDGAADATLATSSAPAQLQPASGTEWTQSSTPQPTANYRVGLAPGQQWAVGSMPMPGPQYCVRPGSMPGARSGAVLVQTSMPPGSGGMMAYPVNMGMHAGRIMQVPHVAPGSNGMYTIQATSLQGYMGARPQGQMPTPQYYMMPYASPPRACMAANAHAGQQQPPAPTATLQPAASAPQPSPHATADAPHANAVPGTVEAMPATASQIYAVDHNRQLLLRHQRMYSTADPAAASGSPSATATASPQQTFVPVAAHQLQGRIYVRPPEAVGGSAANGSSAAASGQAAAAPQEAPAAPHAAQVPAMAPGVAVPHGAPTASGAASASAAPSGSSSQTQMYAADVRQAGGTPGAPSAAPAHAPAVQGAAQHPQQLSGFQGPVFCMAPGQWQHGGRPVFTLQPYYVQPGGYLNGGGHVYASAPMQPQMQHPQTVANNEGAAAGTSVSLKEEPAG